MSSQQQQYRSSDTEEDKLHCGMRQDIHTKHHDYIDVLIQDHQTRLQWRKAIIEKTITSIVWSVIVGMSYAIWDYIRAHLK